MADVRITALPTAQSPITGDELVPVVQNGLTVQTTVSAITQSPSLTQTFLTVGQQTQLPNSRYIATGTGLGFTDAGAQNPYTIALNGTAASLENASSGVVVKTAPNTIAARTLSTSGNGISVTNGDGVSGNPTFQLTGVAQSLANAAGTGLLALGAGSTISPVTITGTADQIAVIGGDGSVTPTIGIANDPVLPGSASVKIPIGTTAQRSVGSDGEMRYNSQSGTYEAYASGTWRDFALSGGVLTFSAGTTGFSPSVPTSAAVTLSGVLNGASGGTGQSSYATGDLLYASGSTALSKLPLSTASNVLVAGASAPEYVAQSTLSVGSATNATNTAITDDTSTATSVYPTWVTANTGNLPQKVTSTKLSFVPSTGALTATGGISGGTF